MVLNYRRGGEDDKPKKAGRNEEIRVHDLEARGWVFIVRNF